MDEDEHNLRLKLLRQNDLRVCENVNHKHFQRRIEQFVHRQHIRKFLYCLYVQQQYCNFTLASGSREDSSTVVKNLFQHLNRFRKHYTFLLKQTSKKRPLFQSPSGG